MIHKFLNGVIVKVLKREMSLYEIEKIKVAIFSLLSIILMVISLIQSLIQGDKFNVFTVYFSISLVFLPLSVLYALPEMFRMFKSITSSTSEGATIFTLYSGNFIVGIILGILYIFIGFFIAILIGLPMSIWNIVNKLSLLKIEGTGYNDETI